MLTHPLQGDNKVKRLAAMGMLLVSIALPGIASAEATTAPVITGVEIVKNQILIKGDGLFHENDNVDETSLIFYEELGGIEVSWTYSGELDPNIGDVLVMPSSEDEIALRPGLIPSTFNGTVKLDTSRGLSNIFKFSVDDPYCVASNAEVASLVGGEANNWTLESTVWRFASDQPTTLAIPGVGTLMVPDQNLGPFGFIEATNAVYGCSNSVSVQLALPQ